MIKLTEFRLKNNILQTQLANYLKVSKSYLSQVENGKCNLSLPQLEKLLKNDQGWDLSVLGCPTDLDELRASATPRQMSGALSKQIVVLEERIKSLEQQLLDKDRLIQERDILIKEKDMRLEDKERLLQFLLKQMGSK